MCQSSTLENIIIIVKYLNCMLLKENTGQDPDEDSIGITLDSLLVLFLGRA